MRGTERRRQILDWLDREQILTLQQLVEHFGISKMTAHRDLEVLEGRRALKRIHGGAVALERPTGQAAGAGTGEAAQASCMICYRPASQHLLYSLTLSSGEQRLACCPHCGVSAHLLLGNQVAMALTADYLTGRPHPAQGSYFVLGSAAVPCCRPSMLTFEDLAMARRFQTGFGGSLGRLEDAITYLREEMSLHRDGENCPHCVAQTRRKSI